MGIGFLSTDALFIGGAVNNFLVTTQVFRDTSAWYHFVVALDTTQGTAANTLKIYVNGVQITIFSTDNRATKTSSSIDLGINQALAHSINAQTVGSALYGNHYLADIYFIDNQALNPTSFGEFDANGIWQPIAYSGSYGTNGFHLPFDDNSTAAALGTDTSGNGNDWAVINISVAAGADNDSLVDVPTNGTETDTGLGGEVRGNYCTLNPLQQGTQLSTYDGLLKVTGGGSNAYNSAFGTIGMSSGKWYWEQTLEALVSQDIQLGIGNRDAPLANFPGSTSRSYGFSSNNAKWNNSASAAYTTSWVNGDVVGLAFDADAGTLTLYKNGSSLGVAFSSIPADTYFPIAGAYNSSSISVLNFGQRPFAYTAPSGFKALCTANLPTPVVTKPSEYMDVKLYTGNGSTQTISGLEFSPDLVWIKNRAQADNHKLLDTVRGATEELESNTTDAEATNADGLTAFNSDGFDLGADVEYNTSTEAYVAWTWDAGSSTVTNNDGTITSQVRANPSAGSSVVTLTSPTGTGNFSAGHGLGVTPGMIIVKSRDAAGPWYVYHKSLATDYYLRLNATDAAATNGAQWGAGMTSSVLGLRASYSTVPGATTVAYCFAPVEGYSAFGSYTGNGSADGPFVFCSFRPRWVMFKETTTGGVTSNWIIKDSSRPAYNVTSGNLYPNLSLAEDDISIANVDFAANGFKIRGTYAGLNASGSVIVYAAFAESPFQYARAR